MSNLLDLLNERRKEVINFFNIKEKKNIKMVEQDPFAIKYIDNPSEKVQLTVIEQKPHNIIYIKNPSERVQLAAVRNDSSSIECIDFPTEKVQLMAVKENPYDIRYINHPTKKVQLLAVREAPITIKSIANPATETYIIPLKAIYKIEMDSNTAIKFPEETKMLFTRLTEIEKIYDEEIMMLDYADEFENKTSATTAADQWRLKERQKTLISFNENVKGTNYLPANDVEINNERISSVETKNVEIVKQNPRAINSIDNPSEKVQVIAVNKDPDCLRLIKNPTEKVQQAAVNADVEVIQFIKNPSEDVQSVAINKNPYLAFKYIDNPSEKVLLTAVQRDGSCIRFINNPSEAVQSAAVKQNGYSIEFIKNPTEKVQILAVQNKPFSIAFIDNPSERVQLAAVRKDGNSIRNISRPSEAVQFTAVKQNPFALSNINSPSNLVEKKVLQKNPYAITTMKELTGKFESKGYENIAQELLKHEAKLGDAIKKGDKHYKINQIPVVGDRETLFADIRITNFKGRIYISLENLSIHNNLALNKITNAEGIDLSLKHLGIRNITDIPKTDLGNLLKGGGVKLKTDHGIKTLHLNQSSSGCTLKVVTNIIHQKDNCISL